MALLLGNFPVTGFAADTDVQKTVAETISVQADPEVDLPENEELFAGFVERELYGYEMATFGTLARENLSAKEKVIYDALKPEIEKIAKNGGSTVFDLSEISGLKTKWTNTELGVASIDNTDFVKAEFKAQFNLSNILTALLSDCPFDLYWYDKTEGAWYNYTVSKTGCQGVWETATITKLTFTFTVADDYWGGENMVTTNVSKVATVKSNAAQVVADNAGKSDYEKLKAYKEYICGAVTYNQAAADDNTTPYGDPWQLIYVFDGDSSTNVVCEGYSKAFQYLCDLSVFTGDTLCYCVSGWMNGGSHMWNIVTLGGRNYLADVTNSDAGTVGKDGSLFLAGGSGSVESG